MYSIKVFWSGLFTSKQYNRLHHLGGNEKLHKIFAYPSNSL